MLYLFSYSDLNHSLFVLLALFFVLFYEAINGFHDTANAVSTLIYTRAMSANVAVAMSGLFNFLGVMLGGLTVAYAIVHLLPNDLLLNSTSKHALAMIFSILLAAIIWNLSTWYFCLPASSSHSLIGAIIGIGLTNAMVTGSSFMDALNIPKMKSVFLSLIFSPIVGLIIAGSLIFLLRKYVNIFNKKLYRMHMTPLEREQIDGKKKPPFFIRMALVLSSIGVSYAHGANDGQKGIGLIMLVLIGILPTSFVINLNSDQNEIICTVKTVNALEKYYLKNSTETAQNITRTKIIHDAINYPHIENVILAFQETQLLLKNISNYNTLNSEQRLQLRHLLLYIADLIDQTTKTCQLSTPDKHFLIKSRKNILKPIEYAPMWIIFIIALALSIGTMIGWKRIVITIGEKIGKRQMTYAQAVSAQITASFSIGIASYTGIPVSTTHILSSSVAGTMLIDGDGIQTNTIKNIALAWLLTLPISILLSSLLYWIALFTI